MNIWCRLNLWGHTTVTAYRLLLCAKSTFRLVHQTERYGAGMAFWRSRSVCRVAPRWADLNGGSPIKSMQSALKHSARRCKNKWWICGPATHATKRWIAAKKRIAAIESFVHTEVIARASRKKLAPQPQAFVLCSISNLGRFGQWAIFLKFVTTATLAKHFI